MTIVAGAVLGAIIVIRLTGASLTSLWSHLVAERALGGFRWTWLVSWQHGVDILNEAALLLVPGVFLLFTRASIVALQASAQTPRIRPVVWMVAGPAVIMLVCQPRIGGARDWDLFSFVTIPSLVIFVDAWHHARLSFSRQDHAAMISPVLVVAIAATVGWLAVNLDPSRSAARLELLQAPHGTFSAFAQGHANEILGSYYHSRDLEASRNAWARAVSASPGKAS